MNLAEEQQIHFVTNDDGNNNDEQKQQSFCCLPSMSSPAAIKTKLNREKERQKQVDPVIAKVLASNLNSLSIEERERILEDIHCCQDESTTLCNKEINDPEFIPECLNELEIEISKVKGIHRNAYDIAYQMDSTYVTSKEFRLKFLRADEYNIQDTRRRIMDHFTSKLELFGKDKLVKDITFDDLSQQEHKLLCAGNQQFLNIQDLKGRTILYVFPELNIPTISWKDYARARWYQYMCAVNENICNFQTKGMIMVVMWTKKSIFDHDNMKGLRLIRDVLPFRITALHNCVVNQCMPSYLRSLLDVIGKRFQARSKFHVEESVLSCLYTLQSYGINPETIPIDTNGRPRVDKFLELTERRIMYERQKSKIIMHSNNENKKQLKQKQKQQQQQQQQQGGENYWKNSSSSTTTTTTATTTTANANNNSNNNSNNNDTKNNNPIVPTSKDVLLGRRNASVQLNSGNTVLERIIQLEVFKVTTSQGRNLASLSRFEKTCLVLSTIERIHGLGGRFLKRDYETGNWIVADKKAIHESTSARIRNTNKKKKI